MKLKTLLILLIQISLLSETYAQSATFRTSYGLVSGIRKNKVLIFKGIPFATPPLGDLRWKAPQNPKPWTGVKKCDKFSASPYQNKPMPFYCWSKEFIAPPEPLSEDCLYLNIWTPDQKTNRKMPVFVWIYGGGFNSGSAACDIYDGESYAKNGVLFVSINYRVGPFGFLAHSELSSEQNNASGNYGIMDQIQALKWIKDNISNFGGDPNNVTIAGQSAGSMSVNALIASKKAKGLFNKAILQSGGLLNNSISTPRSQAEQFGKVFQDSLQVNSLKEMRALSAETIQSTANKLKNGRFGLVLDNYILPENLEKHFENGNHNKVPLLTGWVSGDASLLANGKKNAIDFKKDIETKYPEKAADMLNVFLSNTDEEAHQSQLKLSLLGFAALPSYLLAKYNTSKTYVYEVNHIPTDKENFPNYGAFHTSEVPFVLGNLHKWDRKWQQHDLDIQKTLSSYWINFIKTSNPNGKTLPVWEPMSLETTHILKIDSSAVTIPNMYKKEFEILTSTKK